MATAGKPGLRIIWIVLGVLAVFGISKILFDAAADKDIADHYKVLLPLFFIAWLWVLWRLQPNLPRRLDSISEWSKPKSAASVLYVFLSGLMGFGGVVQLVAPQTFTKKDGEDLTALIKSSQTNIARQKIPGLWGEGGPDCTGNTFRFKINGDALKLVGVRQPPQAKEQFVLDGNIQPPDTKAPQVLKFEITGKVTNGQRETGGATFTYLRNGSSEEMNWDDLVNTDPRKLFKCKVQA